MFFFFRFILICAHLYTQIPIEIFREKFLPKLVSLATDRVANVRISLAKLLRQYIEIGSFFFSLIYTFISNDFFFFQTGEFKNDEKVKNALEKLKNDKDRDVRHFAEAEPKQKSVTPMKGISFKMNETDIKNQVFIASPSFSRKKDNDPMDLSN